MADNKSKKLDCPKCLGLLTTKEVGELKNVPVVIDQCPVCQGIWFDKGELERILKNHVQFDDEMPEKDFHFEWKDDYLDLKRAKCPRCKKELERINAADDDRVVTDYCMDCGGTWLDGGELRELMRGGPIHRAIHYVFDKISEGIRDRRDSSKQ